MTTYNTKNPVPSADARDRYDNSQVFDELMNGAAPSTPDRLGVLRQSWAGMEQAFAGSEAERAAVFQAFLEAIGWSSLGAYAAGINIVSHTQTVDYQGQPYQLKPSVPASLETPYVTTGNWAVEGVNFKLVGDNSLRQTLQAPEGAGLVGHSSSITYPAATVGRTLNTILKRAVFVDPIGGNADDSVNINQIAAEVGTRGDLFFTNANYRVGTQMLMVESQSWHGAGGQRGTNFIKIANCDMIKVGNLCRISDLNFDGVGATYTGKGIVSEGFSVNIERVRVNLTKGACLSFPGAAGGTNVRSFEGGTFEPLTVPAIDFGGVATVRPIFLEGIWLSGGFIDVTGSGNGCSMSNFYVADIKHGVGAGLMHFSNGRVGNSAAPLTLQGSGSTFTGVSFAGDVNIVAGVGFEFAGCAASAITEDAASNSNKFFARGTTTAWTQATGVAPTLGNGTLVMNYVRNGNVVVCQLSLIMGSTTTFGDGASGWLFQLPFVASPNINADGMAGIAYDSSATTDFVVSGQIPAATSRINFGRNGSAIRSSTPFVWAAGDKLTCTFTYLAR